ncbi:peptide/nickel transport system permease protein [Conyzicola lurida]|uniref:Peptide/nickel transport system permease protein n=1 Tax=Conyzicola lurida TaxID=1172621 RepID=A0A841AEJ2_9MICO|nr:ABC transporter permease [Conyzicola lurida]MBB5842160.1 peptide/nickel transport system permease protein [Conyzicola lurida]
MVRYIARRIGEAVFVLFVLSVLVFLMVRIMPGDPAAAFMDPSNPDPSVRAEIYAQLGLDRPWFVQYFSWIGGIFTGDFGRSLTQPYTVGEQLATRFPVSLELGVMATIIGVALGIPIGIASAVRRGKLVDNGSRILTFLLLSVPPFLVGTVLLLINSRTTKFRLLGFVTFEDDPVGHFTKLLLPALLLSLGLLALVARYTRGMLLDTFSQDYIRTARAKGVLGNGIVTGHALRNAMAPVMTVVGVQLASLIGGTVIMENVFALPGMGSLLINAVNTSDYTTIQACVLIIGALYVAISLIVDLLYPLVDPRIRVVRS